MRCTGLGFPKDFTPEPIESTVAKDEYSNKLKNHVTFDKVESLFFVSN